MIYQFHSMLIWQLEPPMPDIEPIPLSIAAPDMAVDEACMLMVLVGLIWLIV